MAIIVREEQIIGGKHFPSVKIYKSDRPLTKELRMQADALDEKIGKKIKEIESEMKSSGLLDLKGKSGVIKLWYEVGKRLKVFDDSELIKPEDRKYLWRALYDHAGELAPGPLTKRVKRSPKTSHFSYCYEIAKFSWDFVESAGDWGAWIAFLDSKVIHEDERIIEWLSSKQKQTDTIVSKTGWIRALNREIRRHFKERDTTVLDTDKELKPELEIIFRKVFAYSKI